MARVYACRAKVLDTKSHSQIVSSSSSALGTPARMWKIKILPMEDDENEHAPQDPKCESQNHGAARICLSLSHFAMRPTGGGSLIHTAERGLRRYGGPKPVPVNKRAVTKAALSVAQWMVRLLEQRIGGMLGAAPLPSYSLPVLVKVSGESLSLTVPTSTLHHRYRSPAHKVHSVLPYCMRCIIGGNEDFSDIRAGGRLAVPA
ncbi:hypothetical protein C8R45DRAFT_1081677 [Mycena sanguinolenta]|nr:hypothetical protein C8R45DRAFT_1081677 [Mycena sanguinolenta]